MSNSKNKNEAKEMEGEDLPPVFGSWNATYWFVALFFCVEVIFFYLFSRYYS